MSRKPKAEAPEGAPKPESTVGKDDRTPTETPCICGCGELVPRLFRPGHDQRLVTFAKEFVRGERELTDEQMEYVEQSGKLERARQRIAEEESKRREKTEAKTAKQREKEGKAEAKKSAK